MMRGLGYLFICVGFLGAVLAVVWQVEGVLVPIYVGFLILGILGVVLARVGTNRLNQAGDRMSANLETVERSLGAVAKAVARLDDEKTETHVYDVHGLIDARTIEDIEDFVEARESIAHAFGLQEYADLMSHFAAGERALNRAWSASTDGYIDEVHLCLTRARDQFNQALERLNALEREPASA